MFRLVLASFAISLLLCTTSLAQGPCELPDNGNGTVTLPDPDCPYRGIGSFHELLDGLPVGTTVIIEAVHLDFFCDQGNMELCNSAGGSLGGETHDFGSQLELRVIGSGAAEGLDETVLVPVDCVVETGPRAGGPTQIFANSMVSLQGSASGVGSFVSISIEAGSAFGLPSPGQTTLVRDGGPGCDFVVESYFDINYRIDYVGAGLLAGFSGTGEGQVRMSSRALGPDPDEIVQDGPFFDRSIECPTFSPATVGPDTFALYGGPGTSAGKFDDGTGVVPDVLGHAPHDIPPGKWFGVDLTDVGGRFVGDFSRIYPRMTDVDPCFENETPVLMFVDDGSCPSNQANNGGSPPCQSTLGSTSFQHNYGVPGGWVNDFVGGLSLGFDSLDNEVWSPEIAWDRPGTDDDAPEVAGAFLRYSVWRHLPYDNGQFYTWRVRSSPDDRVTWTPWRNRGVDYYGGGTGEWVNAQHDISDMLVPGATHVQVALGVRDLAGPLGLPGTDATPSPAFDNVGVFKYRVGGPKITAREDDLFNDSFPQSGEADFHTLVGRQNSDCRLDMARDVGAGASIVPGDSIVVDVVPVIPGTTLTQVRLNWVLDLNPKFDDVRVQPPGTNVIPNGAANAWDQWTGSVNGVAHCPNRFSFDLPDADFMHPGDQLRYYVEATDSDGRTTTMPGSVDGFDTGRTVSSGLYASMFTVNALPSIVDDGAGGWAQPRILLINDFGLRGGQAEYFQTFEQNGWRRGIEWDLYTTLAPSSFLSNGIGSTGAHGANAEQLRGYDVIIYVAGDLSWDLLSDGSNAGGNDKGDDIGVLTAWLNQDADRYIAHFGDDVVSGLIQSSPGTGGTYASTIMGVILNDDDVRDMIGGQRSPRVVPDIGSPCFTLDYAASGIRKVDRNTYDDISPGAGAVISHRFLDPSGLPYAGVGQAASVTSAFTDGQGNQKISITFPYDLSFVDNEVDQPGGPLSERAKLLREIIEDCFGKAVGGGGPPVGIPERLSFRGSRNLQSHPNPFNPATKISFEVGHRTHASVHIYNLRGERVATLLNETIDSGPKEVIWRGVDDSGTAVASGTYFARVVVDGMTEVVKLALLK